MEFKQLRYFVSVAEAGSFTRAAMKLSVDQPALSKQIRRLELALKQSLFRRNGRGVALTEGGEILLPRARNLLRQMEETRLALDFNLQEVQGKVVIGTTADTTRVLTTDFIDAFRASLRKGSLEIIEGKSEVIQEWLISGRVDIGIVHGPALFPGIEAERLAEHPLFLVSPVRSPLTPASATVRFRDLGKFPLILARQPHSISTLVEEEAARLGVRLNVVLHVDGAKFIVGLVRKGHGYAILSAYSLAGRNATRDLRLTEIVEPRLTRAVNLVTPANRPMSRVALESVKLLRRFLGASAPTEAGDE
jgi:LysR family transcriptional regulator, nitrogen assimilation regulatory protein